MAEDVITLDSDDDIVEVMPVNERKRPNPMASTSGSNGTQGATAHISGFKPLDLGIIGIAPTVAINNRMSAAGSASKRVSMPVSRIPRPLGSIASSSQNVPISATKKSNIGIRSGDRVSPATLARLTQSSTSRTRNGQNASNYKQVYEGHYMFDATEAFEPSRRSTRLSAKKIEGRFVCSYNLLICHKICKTATEFINHLWAHVVYDPVSKMKQKEAKENGVYMPLALADTISLSSNSLLAVKKQRTCEYCNTTFTSRHFKQEHLIKCHQEHGDAVCNICELDFPTTKQCDTHLDDVHPLGDSPYHCKKCKYRTSVRQYLFEHFIDKHINEAIICPLCVYQEDLSPTVRRTKLIALKNFENHMRLHATRVQLRCRMCALSFNSRAELDTHRVEDHSPLDPLWIVNERHDIHQMRIARTIRISKIFTHNKKHLSTREGSRITDEVACQGNGERGGYDLTSISKVLHKCDCGYKTWNGNRTASHRHRCQKPFKDIERVREIVRNDGDPDDELDIFAVYPQPTLTEKETKNSHDIKLRKLRLEKDDENKVRTSNIVFEPIDNSLMLKILCNPAKDDGSKIIDNCLSAILALDD